MKIIVTGASGLVGSALVAFWRSQGHQIGRAVRASRALQPDEMSWHPDTGLVNPACWEGWDLLVHLAGESVMQRWSPANKAKIRDSRVEATRKLCRDLSLLEAPPPLLICASAIGYYGDRGEEWLTEASAQGKGFLAEVCGEWEEATKRISDKGGRVLHLRFGMVLSADGGALKKMLPLFRWGLGGTLGTGRQYVSWIALDDLVQVVDFAMRQPGWEGPLNAVSPRPLPNAEFTAILAHVLRRPAFFSVPSMAIRLALGDFGRELLLSSQRVAPARLEEAGFRFAYPDLESALRHALATESA